MKRILRTIFCILVVGGQAHALNEDDPVARRVAGTRTTSLGCGSRAVYLLLTAAGLQPKLPEIEKALDPDGDGIANAADMIRYLRNEWKKFKANADV